MTTNNIATHHSAEWQDHIFKVAKTFLVLSDANQKPTIEAIKEHCSDVPESRVKLLLNNVKAMAESSQDSKMLRQFVAKMEIERAY